MPLPEAHADKLRWLADVTDDDVALHGLASERQAGDTPADVLRRWAADSDVDLARVHDALVFLAGGPHLLLGGGPLALMSFSPRLGRYCASFDTEFPPEVGAAGFARAGVWLAMLASEIGELPDSPGHWLAVTVGPDGMCGQNAQAVARYRHYARIVAGLDDEAAGEALTDYDRAECRAVWRCVGYALR